MTHSIGTPDHVASLPLSLPIDRHALPGAYTPVGGSMPELTDRLLAGDLAAGPVTPLTWLRHRDRLELVPNLSISSFGLGGSLLLFSRVPLNQLDGETVLSRYPYGVDLLTWLLGEMFAVRPQIRMDGDAGSMRDRAAAALVAGDEALLEAQVAGQAGDDEHVVWDLGDAWWQITQTPLVYLLWATRKDLPAADREALVATLTGAKAAGLGDRAALLAEAQHRTGLSSAVVDGYLHRFNYDLTPAHQRGVDLLGQYLPGATV